MSYKDISGRIYGKLDNIESILEGIIKDTSSAPDVEEAQEVTEEV